MDPLELFGRHRNLAITSSVIPQVIEGIHSLEVIRIEGSESLDIGTSPIFEYKVLLKTPAELSHIPVQVLLESFDLGAMIGKISNITHSLRRHSSYRTQKHPRNHRRDRPQHSLSEWQNALCTLNSRYAIGCGWVP